MTCFSAPHIFEAEIGMFNVEFKILVFNSVQFIGIVVVEHSEYSLVKSEICRVIEKRAF